MILTIRTDKPESELGLFDGDTKLVYETWAAHRQLAETIHKKLDELLKAHGKSLKDITGIVIYKGPGSFTGLRIGMSVANALAYSYDVPITVATGDNWITDGLKDIKDNPSKLPAMPEYGGTINITKPRK